MKGLGIGRVVHFVTPAGPVPAIVTEVFDSDPEGGNGCCNLTVFNRGLITYASSVLFRDAKQGAEPNTWHWPEHA